MIQATPHMRVLVAVDPVDFRKGIDGLARLARAAPTLSKELQLIGDIVDAQRRVNTCGVEDVNCVCPSASYLPDEVEVLLAQRLSELVDDVGEESHCAWLHVLHRVDTVAIDFGVGNPELINLRQMY